MKKIIYLLGITFLMLQSCSSDGSSDNQNNPAPSGGILLKKIVSSDGSIHDYSYDGNKLVNMAYEGLGTKNNVKFTYTGDLITKIELSYNSKFVETTVVFSYTNNNLNQVRRYSKDGILTSVQDYTYDNGTITTTRKESNGDIDLSRFKEFYNSVGNIYKVTEYFNMSNIFDMTYDYDVKNNPFKNIIGISIFTRFQSDLIFMPTRGSMNNLIKTTNNRYSGDNITVSYQYNDNNYPISATINDNGQTNTLKYYYY